MSNERHAFARRLRQRATGPEDILWDLLRGRRLDGLKFRRQVPILAYTVDFLCIERKLVIELDGRQHGWEAAYDNVRTEEIESHGFMLIRFQNSDILNERDAVIARIREVAGTTFR